MTNYRYKVECSPYILAWRHKEGLDSYISTLSLFSALYGGGLSTPRTVSFAPEKEKRYRLRRTRGGPPGAGTDGCGRSCHHRDSIPWSSVSVPKCSTKYVEIKCQLDATDVFIGDLIACSTGFGHHYAHHQELKSIIQWLLPVVFRAVVFKLLVWCGVEGYVSGLQDVSASCKPDT